MSVFINMYFLRLCARHPGRYGGAYNLNQHRSYPQRVYSQVGKVRYNTHTKCGAVIIACITAAGEGPPDFTGGRGFRVV